MSPTPPIGPTGARPAPFEPPPPPRSTRPAEASTLGAIWSRLIRWRGIGPTAIALVVGAIVLSGLSFTNAEGLRMTAEQSAIGIRAQDSLAAAAAARNEAAQALLVASVAGDLDDAAVTASLDLVDTALGRFDSRAVLLAEVAEDPEAVIAAAADLHAELVALALELAAADGSVDVATFGAEIEPAYRSFEAIAVNARDTALARLEVEQSSAGQVAGAARLVIVVFVPLILILSFRVTTARRQNRRELQISLRHERTLNRVKDEAIANLSHELRTPLTSIQGFTLAMLDDDLLTDPEAAREMVEIIAKEAVDLGRMVDDLLTAARSQADALDLQLAATDVAFEVEAMLEPFLATGAVVYSNLPDGKVMADQLRLRQILRNLVSNALKHGGSDVRVDGQIVGGGFAIEVSDDGPGVPDHVRQRMFSRFVHEGETPLTTGSVGLGLSITRELAEMMDGEVRYERRDGRTIFRLTLPLA